MAYRNMIPNFSVSSLYTVSLVLHVGTLNSFPITSLVICKFVEHISTYLQETGYEILWQSSLRILFHPEIFHNVIQLLPVIQRLLFSEIV